MVNVIIIAFTLSKVYSQIDSVGIPEADTTKFILTNEAPQYPGGFVGLFIFINNNMKTPEGVCEAHGCTTFFIKFTISSTGEVKDVSVTTRMRECPAYEKEIERVFRLQAKWKPGIVKGKPMNIYYKIPMRIRFP